MITFNILQNNNIEVVDASIISHLYEQALADDLLTINLSGNLLTVLCSRQAYDYLTGNIEGTNDKRFPNLNIVVTGDYFITFQDSLVEDLLKSYFNQNTITEQYLSTVTTISTGNTTGVLCNTGIKYFNEYKYFTGITTNSVGYGLYGLSKLEEITFPTVNLFLNPNNTTDASKGIPSYCLSGATSLRKVDMSGITCLTWGGVIGDCPNLTWSGVKMPNAKYYSERIFRNCTSLEKVIFPEGTLECAGVLGCTSIQYVEYPTTLTAFYAHMSYHGTSNVSIVFKSVVPPTYTPYNSAESNLKNMFGNGNNALNSNGSYIYVPDNSVTAYKTADKWSYYESIIKPLSQLPAERLSMGTVTQADIDRV